MYSFSYLEPICCSMSSCNCCFLTCIGFSRGRLGGLVFPSLSEFSTIEAETNTLATWCEELTHWKDPDAGRDWRQEEKGTTEDEMVGWHHWVDGHGFVWTLWVGDGQGGLVCCGSWGRKELDMTERLNWTDGWFISNIFRNKWKKLVNSVVIVKDSMDQTLFKKKNLWKNSWKDCFKLGSTVH